MLRVLSYIGVVVVVAGLLAWLVVACFRALWIIFGEDGD